MAVYTVTMPDGRTLDLEGDSPPTEAELEQIYASLPEQPTGAPAGSVEQALSGGLAAIGADPSTVGGAAQEFHQGLTLGFGDEGQAAIGALIAKVFGGDATANMSFGELFDQSMRQQAESREQFQRENPGTALAANIAGGLVSGSTLARGGMGAARAVAPVFRGAAGTAGTTAGTATRAQPLVASGAQAAPSALSRTAAAATPGVTPGQAATAAVGGGTAAGAVAGAGTAEGGLEDRFRGAAEGALLGGLFGLGGVGLTQGARGLWRSFRPDAQAQLAKAASDAGLSPTDVASRLNALGPGATLADVAESFQAVGDVAATRLGPAARRVRDLVRRDERQFSRLMRPISRMLGSEDAGVETIGALKRVREERASPLYNRAFDAGVEMTDRLRDLLSRPATQTAWRRTQRIGRSDPDMPAELLEDGVDPSFRGWQHITEQLRDSANRAANNNQAKEAGTIRRLRASILEELDAQSPDFAEARALWAGTKAADDAIEEGQAFMKRSLPEIRETLKDMGDADKAFYRMGVGHALEEWLSGAADTQDLTRRFRNEAFRRKLREIAPDNASAVDFINTVRAEAIKKNTANTVGRNSLTQQRRAVQEQLTGGSVNLETPNTAGLIQRAIGAVRGAGERTIQDLGEMTLSQDPADQARALALMAQRPTPTAGVTLGPTGAGAVGGGSVGILNLLRDPERP